MVPVLPLLNISECATLFSSTVGILVQTEMGPRGKDSPPCKLASHLSPGFSNHWRFSIQSSPSINSSVQRAEQWLSEASFLVKRAGLQGLQQPQLMGREWELVRAIQGVLFAETLTTEPGIKQASCDQQKKEKERHPLANLKEHWEGGEESWLYLMMTITEKYKLSIITSRLLEYQLFIISSISDNFRGKLDLENYMLFAINFKVVLKVADFA